MDSIDSMASPSGSNPTVAPAGSGASHGRPSGGDAGKPRSTPEQREKWRRKAAEAYARRLASAGPVLPSVGRAASPSSSGAPSVGSDPASKTTVPWDGGTLKPLFEQLIPAAEQFFVEKLKSQASRIDTALVAEVEKDAAWNSTAKAGLLSAGPLCVAEALNDMGVGSEKAHWAALILAAGSIATSHLMLAQRLEKLRLSSEKRPRHQTNPVEGVSPT